MNSKKNKIDIELLKSLRGAVAGDPVTPEELRYVKTKKLPSDLILFLCTVNGFAWNGIEIFSLAPGSAETDDFFYSVPDIFSRTKNFNNYYPENASKYLPVGRSDEDIYLYSRQTGKYSINDRIDLMEYESFEKFINLLEHVLAERGYAVNLEIKKIT